MKPAILKPALLYPVQPVLSLDSAPSEWVAVTPANTRTGRRVWSAVHMVNGKPRGVCGHEHRIDSRAFVCGCAKWRIGVHGK